jgi:hypothetical protein
MESCMETIYVMFGGSRREEDSNSVIFSKQIKQGVLVSCLFARLDQRRNQGDVFPFSCENEIASPSPRASSTDREARNHA